MDIDLGILGFSMVVFGIAVHDSYAVIRPI